VEDSTPVTVVVESAHSDPDDLSPAAAVEGFRSVAGPSLKLVVDLLALQLVHIGLAARCTEVSVPAASCPFAGHNQPG